LLEANLTTLAYPERYPRKGAPCATPFLKWAGGKSQLLATYSQFFPSKFNNYYEPFIGAGAVFFRLASEKPNMNATISDCNAELINCYEQIRSDVTSVIEALKLFKNDEDFFYAVRAQNVSKLNQAQQAARMIFLNKTCFNGLYRVNKNGQFNVPFGRYKNPKMLDEENLRAVSNTLSKVKIFHRSFEQVAADAKKGDFVYFDPPYVPLTNTANFTSYTQNSFGLKEQQHLAETFRKLARRGCHVMLSNSDTAIVRELYSDFHLFTVKATRAINCQPDKRGQITELVVTNYR
jgi:DNA adenine methylase